MFDVVRSTVPKMNLDDVFTSKEEIAQDVKEQLKKSMGKLLHNCALIISVFWLACCTCHGASPLSSGLVPCPCRMACQELCSYAGLQHVSAVQRRLGLPSSRRWSPILSQQAR